MYREYYRVTYRKKEYDFKEPFMFNCYSDMDLNMFKALLLGEEYYDVKIYKVLESYELLEEI